MGTQREIVRERGDSERGREKREGWDRERERAARERWRGDGGEKESMKGRGERA